MQKLLVLFLISIALIIVSCTKQVYPSFDYNQSENPWMLAFKDRVFLSALKEAYQSDTSIFKHIEQKDALNPYDGLTLDEMSKADELGHRLIQNMPAPSMCENCPADVNYFMATCLHYYNSRELDLVAKKLNKQHQKNKIDNSLAYKNKISSNDYLVREEDYVKAYKAFVFYGCLNEGTKGDFFQFLKKNNDLGLFSETEVIFHSTANNADSLGRIYSHKIVPFDYGDGKEQMPNFSNCYLYSMSNEIDSIAKINYRKL